MLVFLARAVFVFFDTIHQWMLMIVSSTIGNTSRACNSKGDEQEGDER